jgi:hypothetical protein
MDTKLFGWWVNLCQRQNQDWKDSWTHEQSSWNHICRAQKLMLCYTFVQQREQGLFYIDQA